MKSINRLLILVTIVLLSMNQCAIGQEDAQTTEDAETTIITLYVDTANIDQPDPADHCYLIAVSPGSAPIYSGTGEENIKIFFNQVDLGDTVFWNGISSNAPGVDSVCIERITWKRGSKIFPEDPKEDSSGDCTVQGTTEKKAGRNDKYSYQIKFTVSTKPNPFIIDPRIQVN